MKKLTDEQLQMLALLSPRRVVGFLDFFLRDAYNFFVSFQHVLPAICSCSPGFPLYKHSADIVSPFLPEIYIEEINLKAGRRGGWKPCLFRTPTAEVNNPKYVKCYNQEDGIGRFPTITLKES
jgi:hypothetical protein